MEKGGASSMDASVQDVWDWEVLPDGHRSFYAESRAAPPSPGSEVLLAGNDRSVLAFSLVASVYDYDPLEFHFKFSSL
jgi:hypothetical protein